eukprot:4615696-Prymnesium_polylepis.1
MGNVALSWRRVSEAKKTRASVGLGSTWATGRPSRSHAVKGTRNSVLIMAAAVGTGALAQESRAAPSASGAGTAPQHGHVKRDDNIGVDNQAQLLLVAPWLLEQARCDRGDCCDGRLVCFAGELALTLSRLQPRWYRRVVDRPRDVALLCATHAQCEGARTVRGFFQIEQHVLNTQRCNANAGSLAGRGASHRERRDGDRV